MLDLIGIIHSPFQNMKNMPIQPKGTMDIEIFDGVTNSSSGWMTADCGEVAEKRSDGRFV